MTTESRIDYRYADEGAAHTHRYLWGPVGKVLEHGAERKVFDLGCGNGAFARHLKSLGFEVTGVDPSEEGIIQARSADPALRLETGNAYEPLAERYGTFPWVTSLEVVEHVYYPRKFARCVADLLQPGGRAIVSTPYHGYLKNLALAVTGKMDAHFTALWDHGHIKFWSVETLDRLFAEVGLVREDVLRVGRIPLLAKSMILVFRKP
jgi:2-polyprenyl-6-hydroxyphenyl methylase/3-demethylubiquinone-9 3-methyltransferase